MHRSRVHHLAVVWQEWTYAVQQGELRCPRLHRNILPDRQRGSVERPRRRGVLDESHGNGRSLSSSKTVIGDLLEIVRKGLLVVRVPRNEGTTHPSGPSCLVSGKATVHSEGISVSPAIEASIVESVFPTARSLGEAETPERYDATELRDQLRCIMQSEQDESYWCIESSASPIPRLFQRATKATSSLTAQSLEPLQLRGSILRIPESSAVDYGDPLLDPDDWNFVLDNEFAFNFLSDVPASINVASYSEIPANICTKCHEFRRNIWSPMFRISYDVDQLRQNAEAQTCPLCCLLWQTDQEHRCTISGTVQFE
jgi:hypothetical protein